MKIKNLLIGLMAIFALNATCFAEYDPKAIKAYNYGIDLTNRENYEEAVKSFENALKIEPSFTDAYYNLGILYQYLGNQAKALESYQKILDYNPEDYEVIYKIATIYHNNGEKDVALEYVKLIPEDDPNFGLITKLIKPEEKEEIDEPEEIQEIKEVRKYETYSGFEGPTGVARDSKGNLYVANYSDNSIVCIDYNGERKTIAQNGAIKGPLGLAIDKNDNIYIANYESNQIVLIPQTDRTPQVLPFIVKKPYFLMIDNTGVLYVSEQGSNSVSQHKLELE